MESSSSTFQRTFLLFRNLAYATFAYTLVVTTIHLIQTGTIDPFSNGKPPTRNTETKVTVGGKSGLGSGTNWRLRPESLVVSKDDYLGARPHVDTIANFTKLVNVCRGSEEGLERMRYVHDCLKYLDEKESDYSYIPSNPPSTSSSDYPSIEKAEKPTKSSIGTCSGPIVPYHTYWTGPSTWRVELFIKSYLYTQNLPCSRLHLWLDADAHPGSLEAMMKDKGFARFLPLVERGDIILHEWTFPSRIPLPPSPENAYSYNNKERYSSSSSDSLPAPNANGEIAIGDNVIRDKDGLEWLIITPRQLTFLPVAISDAVRFVVLHLYGGVYCDMDILMLRDFRPLLIAPEPNFAERWAVHNHPGDYNTAVMALAANTSLSSYLLRGGVRMGLNFHPRIIGRMAWKDGRNEEFKMFETGLFDPIWGEFNWGREGKCTIPCFKDYGMVFIGDRDKVAASGEWESYDGPPLQETYPVVEKLRPRSTVAEDAEPVEEGRTVKAVRFGIGTQAARRKSQIPSSNPFGNGNKSNEPSETIETELDPILDLESHTDSTDASSGPYEFLKDRYPPNNRTLEHFFRGAYSYHIHNQWLKHPQPNSWFDIIQKAQDGFFAGKRKNPYGEYWSGPQIIPYERWVEYD